MKTFVVYLTTGHMAKIKAESFLMTANGVRFDKSVGGVAEYVAFFTYEKINYVVEETSAEIK